MAFKIASYDSDRNAPHEYLAAGAITPKLGLALVFSSGVLALATGTAKPEYICMTEGNTLTSGTVIPVFKVLPDMIFETTNAASLSGVAVGTKLTIHTDGAQVTGTDGGCAMLVSKAGDTAGSKVRVRFVEADPPDPEDDEAEA